MPYLYIWGCIFIPYGADVKLGEGPQRELRKIFKGQRTFYEELGEGCIQGVQEGQCDFGQGSRWFVQCALCKVQEISKVFEHGVPQREFGKGSRRQPQGVPF